MTTGTMPPLTGTPPMDIFRTEQNDENQSDLSNVSSRAGRMSSSSSGSRASLPSLAELSVEDENSLSDDQKRVLLINYYQTLAPCQFNKETLDDIGNKVRRLIVQKVKFISNENTCGLSREGIEKTKQFPSFWQQDLRLEKGIAYDLFQEFPDLKEAGMKDKAAAWMGMRQKVKDCIRAYRTTTQTSMQEEVVNGLKELDKLEREGIDVDDDIEDDGATESQNFERRALRGLKKLREIGKTDDVVRRIEGFRKLRSGKDVDLLRGFVHFCLKNVIFNATWTVNRSDMRLGEMFTIQDEAFALMLMMNCWVVWEDKAKGVSVERGRKAKTIFTNTLLRVRSRGGDVKEVLNKGWNNASVKEFNNCMKYLKTVRNLDSYKLIEMSLLEEYKELDKDGRKAKRRRVVDDDLTDLLDIEEPMDAYNFDFVQL